MLSQPIDPDWVEVRYPDVPYLPGAWYRKVLDEAFGIGGWSLMEASRSHREPDGYVQMYVLKVGKVPIKKVAGYMRTPGDNEQLSPGIAMEGMRTNAIMRVCKDLGVARELWLPAWCRRWLAEHCAVVKTLQNGRKIYARKDDPDGYDAATIAADFRAMAEERASYGDDAIDHLDAIRADRRVKSADQHARNAAKKMQMMADLEDHVRTAKIEDDLEDEHDGWEEDE